AREGFHPEIVGACKVDDAGERHRAAELERPARLQLATADPAPPRHPERELPARGVSQRDDPAQVETVLRRERPQVVGRTADVEERARPAAPRVAEATVLDVPGRI